MEYGRTDGRTDGKDGRTDGRTERQTDRRTGPHGPMERCADRPTDRPIDQETGRPTDRPRQGMAGSAPTLPRPHRMSDDDGDFHSPLPSSDSRATSHSVPSGSQAALQPLRRRGATAIEAMWSTNTSPMTAQRKEIPGGRIWMKQRCRSSSKPVQGSPWSFARRVEQDQRAQSPLRMQQTPCSDYP